MNAEQYEHMKGPFSDAGVRVCVTELPVKYRANASYDHSLVALKVKVKVKVKAEVLYQLYSVFAQRHTY